LAPDRIRNNSLSKLRPTFFASPLDVRAWLTKHHEQQPELVVGFWKVGSRKASVTWPQAIEEAVAFGWIDGVRHSLDTESYTVRFTPRNPTSTWSKVNIATAKRLIAEHRMAPAGLRAFAARKTDKSVIYAYEQRENPMLSEAEVNALKTDAQAWAYFSSRPPSYRKTATWWIVSAKKPETRSKRLAQLISDSHAGRPVPPLTPRPGK
jgi:uncharacterized protein YdeI (YjbR/CyaY-like superfamily)